MGMYALNKVLSNQERIVIVALVHENITRASTFYASVVPRCCEAVGSKWNQIDLIRPNVPNCAQTYSNH